MCKLYTFYVNAACITVHTYEIQCVLVYVHCKTDDVRTVCTFNITYQKAIYVQAVHVYSGCAYVSTW